MGIQYFFVFLILFDPVKLQCSFTALDRADYIGCWKDDAARKYLFLYGGVHFNNMTVDFCILGCTDEGFQYAAVQGVSWCFCGDYDPYLTSAAYPKVPDAECNMACSGNQNQMCGSAWRSDIYKIHNLKSDITRRKYKSIYVGQSITTYPLSTETVTGTGMSAINNCAQSCSNTLQCKVFSYSSKSNMCYKFKGVKLCDPTTSDEGSSVFYLL